MPANDVIKDFTTLKKNLKKSFEGFRVIRLALLGDNATQLLAQAICSYGFEARIKFELFEADYNQVDRQITDTSSELYKFEPEVVLIYQSTQRMQAIFAGSTVNDRKNFGDKRLGEVRTYYKTITSNSKAKVVYLNFPEVNDGVFGNYANTTALSFLYQLRKINLGLMDLARESGNLFICDLQLLGGTCGQTTLFDPKLYYSAGMTLALDALPLVAKQVTDVISAMNGRIKKCLILDLDNTLWGGVIGDDGIENIEIGDLGLGKAFTALQLWIKQLSERGIILAVCSKNEEVTAKEPFEKHPDMVLKLADIAIFVANWNNKADNIRYIQSVLNIGFDSMVFVDDNPVERELVKTNLPDVTVPDLPEDPALYLDYLCALNLFETASYSEEDERRNKQYQEEAGRVMAQKNFTNENDFLKGLDMKSEVRPFTKFNIPRVAQLSQRSNQFNLRTVRYSEQDIENLSVSDKHINLCFTLKDRFGDNGLIAVLIASQQAKLLFIETWLMSCRVLKRGMEHFVLNTLVSSAKQAGFSRLRGEYLPTAKNGMVREHYQNLGFESVGNYWELDLTDYKPRQCFIEQV